jgi:hypothetical protein
MKSVCKRVTTKIDQLVVIVDTNPYLNHSLLSSMKVNVCATVPAWVSLVVFYDLHESHQVCKFLENVPSRLCKCATLIAQFRMAPDEPKTDSGLWRIL